MKRVLITGMSGTGKSAVVRELAARGHWAVDLDTPEWSQWVDADASDTLTPGQGKDWVWREDLSERFSRGDEGTLFISGCAETMRRLFPLIDTIILLSAPIATIMKRLEARSSDGYGNTDAAEGRRAHRNDRADLRKSASHEIDTSRPVWATVDEILKLF